MAWRRVAVPGLSSLVIVQVDPNPNPSSSSSSSSDDPFADIDNIGFAPARLKIFLDAHRDNSRSERLAARDCYRAGGHAAGDVDYLFARWTAAFEQGEEQFDMDQRISAGRPWDVDTFSNPNALKVRSFKQFARAFFRSAHPLSMSKRADGVMVQGVSTCLSLMVREYKDRDGRDKIKCVVLLDKTPEFRIEHICHAYSRGGFTRDISRLESSSWMRIDPRSQSRLEQLSSDMAAPAAPAHTQAAAAAPNPLRRVVFCIVRRVLEDVLAANAFLAESIDHCNFALADQTVVDQPVSSLWSYLAFWRATLIRQTSSLLYLRDATETLVGGVSSSTAAAGPADREHDLVLRQIGECVSELERSRSLIDSTLQVLMSSLSITESQRAIGQAVLVTKLAYLGFFFIPITFVATLFGMNIWEFRGDVHWGVWVGASLGAMALSYAVLFVDSATQGLSRLPEMATRGRNEAVDRLVLLQQWIRWNGLLFVRIFCVLAIVGAAVGIWKMVSISGGQSGGPRAGLLAGLVTLVTVLVLMAASAWGYTIRKRRVIHA